MESPRPKPSKAVVVALYLFICCGLPLIVAGPVYQGMFGISGLIQSSNYTANCANNMRKMGVSVEQYTLDNNGSYPLGANWVDVTWRYVASKPPEDESASCYRCPSVWRTQQQGFGYAINSEVAGRSSIPVREELPIPILFESSDIARNASRSPKTLPDPARHHNRGVRLNHGINQNGGLMEFTGPYKDPRKAASDKPLENIDAR